MAEMIEFGRWVKQRRKALDMTQQELAAWVGCSASAIIKIESGARRPSIQIAQRMLEYLEVPAEEHSSFLQLARGISVVPAESPPTNLPASLTSLIGREVEIERVRKLLHDGARLVTLIGPGGIGKTRLSLEAASGLLDSFKDGVFFVALAPISEGSLVALAIAQAVGVRETSGQSLRETLIEYLRSKKMLLVLDNFEQVVAAAPLLTEMLAAAPGLKMLVTSRARLHLYGEQQFPVPPLSLPDAPARLPVEELLESEAIRLFVERARLVQPDFSIRDNSEQAEAVAEICRRLDGLPLAIELAAARANLLAPDSMLGRLASPLELLTGGPQDLHARQQTLEGAIEWSYKLLDEDERTLFRYISVFAGGCILDAVEAVCFSGAATESLPMPPPLGALRGVESLVGKSLLQQYEGSEGKPRFRMLETIHEYAARMLAKDPSEAETARSLHTRYYLGVAEEAEPQLAGADQARWLARLEDEHDNLRAALRLSKELGGAECALRIAGALWRFWLVRGYYSEGRAHLAEALAIASNKAEEHSKPPHSIMALRAKALNGAGILAWRQNDYGPARLFSEESLSIYRQLGDKQGIAQALNNLGNLAHRQGDYDAARSLFEESLEARRNLGDKRGIADSLNNLAMVVDEQGDYGLAHTLYEESLAVRREVGDLRGVANSLNNLALVSWEHGDYANARSLLEESLDMYRELGDKRGIANALNNIGLVAWEMGEYDASLPFYRESLERYRELEDRQGITDCFDGLARVAGSQGDPVRAARLWGAAEALREAIGISIPPGDVADYERNVAQSRAALDDSTWQSTWRKGRTMPLDRAIAYALEGIERTQSS
jgi:predicted ATPase/DNA-binding XRE family transcriptional regulator